MYEHIYVDQLLKWQMEFHPSNGGIYCSLRGQMLMESMRFILYIDVDVDI